MCFKLLTKGQLIHFHFQMNQLYCALTNLLGTLPMSKEKGKKATKHKEYANTNEKPVV